MPGYIGDYRFHVHPDQFFQYNRPDEVGGTGSRVAAVAGAYKMVLPLLKVVGGAVAHFGPAVSAVNHAGEQAAFPVFVLRWRCLRISCTLSNTSCSMIAGWVL